MEEFTEYFNQSEVLELVTLYMRNFQNTSDNSSELEFDYGLDDEENEKDEDDNIYKFIYMAPNLIFVMNICSLIIGLVGNIMACTVILRSKCIYTSTNYYLLNLSISDLLFLITRAPFEIYSSYYRIQIQYKHSITCFLHYWSFQTSATSSTLTVTIFTIERYLAICHPFVARSMLKISRVRKIIVFIWFAAALLALMPWALEKFSFKQYSNELGCMIDFDPSYATFFSIIFFFIPTTVIATMYILIGIELNTNLNNKKIRAKANNDAGKTLKMLVLIVVAFALCWAPFYISEMIMMSLSHRIDDLQILDVRPQSSGAKFSELGFDDFIYEYDSAYVSFQIIRFLFTLKSVTYTLAPTVNPIIYTMMSKNFRQGFKELVTDFRTSSSRVSSKWRSSSYSGTNANASFRAKTSCDP